MAKLHKQGDPNVVECYGGPSGRKLVKAIRRSGQIVTNGTISGTVKTGLDVVTVAEMLRGTGRYTSVHVTMAGAALPGPIVSEAKAAARKAAAERRQAAYQAERAAEATTLASGGVRAVALDALRKGRAPSDGRSRYVYDMARFHAGRTGGYIGTAIMADMALPSDISAEERDFLDKMADELAILVFGNNDRAARMWGQALGII